MSEPADQDLDRAAELLATAVRPVFVLGSQVVRDPSAVPDLRAALERFGAPVYLSGMARGLLGRNHPLWVRHRRGEALKRADLVFLVGVPADFRLGYGRAFARRAKIVAINLSVRQARLNLRPALTVVADPATVLTRLAPRVPDTSPARFAEHLAVLRTRDDEREQAIEAGVDDGSPTAGVNPVRACQLIEQAIGSDSVLVVDGGDFVATASYVVAPRAPLSWLDPGVFGTLGVGAGFAMAAQLARPDAEVWVLYGDGSVGFTISEFDSFVRHGLPVIAVVGNDAGWTQIARDQVPLLGDDVGTVLARTDYHRVVEGFGAKGLVARTTQELAQALDEAKALAREGHPVLVNVHLGSSEFRKGSVSM